MSDLDGGGHGDGFREGCYYEAINYRQFDFDTIWPCACGRVCPCLGATGRTS